MPVDSESLSFIARHYAAGMTSIRGRRVQRLIKREFAGAEHVLAVQSSSGINAILGLSPTGAALCATDGTGKHATVFKWLHGSSQSFEVRFDLLKDSLPVLGTHRVPLTDLRRQFQLRIETDAVPPEARPLLASVLQALA